MKSLAGCAVAIARQTTQMSLRGSGGGSRRTVTPGVSAGRLPLMYSVQADPLATIATVS